VRPPATSTCSPTCVAALVLMVLETLRRHGEESKKNLVARNGDCERCFARKVGI